MKEIKKKSKESNVMLRNLFYSINCLRLQQKIKQKNVPRAQYFQLKPFLINNKSLRFGLVL